MIRVSDHALLRFLERTGAAEVEALRTVLAQSLQRAHNTAIRISEGECYVVADGLRYVIRNNTVVTVLYEHAPTST